MNSNIEKDVEVTDGFHYKNYSTEENIKYEENIKNILCESNNLTIKYEENIKLLEELKTSKENIIEMKKIFLSKSSDDRLFLDYEKTLNKTLLDTEEENIRLITEIKKMKESISQIKSDNIRSTIVYDSKQKEKISSEKKILSEEIKILNIDDISIIHEIQEKVGKEILNILNNKKIVNTMVLMPTQSGKTGCMLSVIKQISEDPYFLILKDHIYIITGLSSTEWKNQTKIRMPPSIQARVFHRDDLIKSTKLFINEIKDKKNILIIIDELQVAAKKDQTIYKTFSDAGLLDISILYENDIKILEYTATPDGTIYDLMRWGESSEKIIACPGEGYISSHDLLKNGRVKQYKDLCGYNKKTGDFDENVYTNIEEIRDDIEEKYKDPRYHIIRIKGGIYQDITIGNFTEIFPDYEIKTYFQESEYDDINKILEEKPKKHTFIFIKEMLRCAKTLTKKYVGILYDRYTTRRADDSTIIQGLIGRDTGYNNNGDSMHYTNIESIEKYDKLFKSNFEDTSIKWNSKTTKYLKGDSSSRNTFLNPNEWEFSSSDDDEPNIDYEPNIKKFKTQDELIDCLNQNFRATKKSRGIKIKKPNEHGYYVTTRRTTTKVFSCQEIDNDKKWGLNTALYFRHCPCYKDINDKSSLEWWIIYIDKNKNEEKENEDKEKKTKKENKKTKKEDKKKTNKKEDNTNKKEKMSCACGSTFRISGKTEHEKSKKHLKFIDS